MLNGSNNMQLLEVGYCQCLEKLALNNGRWRQKQFPNRVAVIKHPQHGIILFDTGYHENFFSTTKNYPEKLYRLTTPVQFKQQDRLSSQLEKLHITAEDVNYVFISHFHADHIAGLKQFRHATFICAQEAYQQIAEINRWRGTLKGLLPSLLPDDFVKRTIFLEKQSYSMLPLDLYPFELGIDLFSDNSLYAIHLPGHASGHWGLLNMFGTTPDFLIGDAAWDHSAYQENIAPHQLAYLVMDNKALYLQTLTKLQHLYELNKDINIIPSHAGVHNHV